MNRIAYEDGAEMKIFLVIVLLLSVIIANAENKQFPEEGKIYVPGADTGFDQYASKSTFHTKAVALTFDDGPDPIQTPRLLDVLKKYNVKATFFILTEKINNKTLPLVKRIALEGHTIASHHQDHENNNMKPLIVYRAELKKSIQTIAKILEDTNNAHREIYYRFPYGAYGSKGISFHHFNVMKEVSQELFGDNCINFAFWDIDSLDWLAPMSQSDVISNVVANVIGGKAYIMKKSWLTGKLTKSSYNLNHPNGGGVILMHDIHARSVDTVGPLLERFKREGIEVKPLYEIEEYSYHGKECRLKV